MRRRNAAKDSAKRSGGRRDSRRQATRDSKRRGLPGRGSTNAQTEAETRARLLAAASVLFADKGFKDVTVRALCRAADANVAAVNYHFGDKLELYRAVLQSAIARMRDVTDDARKAGNGQSAEAQLRTFVSVFIRRLLSDRSGTVYRLITRETMDPTPALDTIIEQAIRPRIEYLSGLIADIIGCDVHDPRVRRSVASLSTQFAAYIPNPIAERIGRTLGYVPEDEETIAKHIADFTVAGILAIAADERHRR